MNKVTLIGRLTREPEVRYSQSSQPTAVARYTLAVDRKMTKAQIEAGQERQADFISCVAFGRQGEFVEKYLHKGIKIAIEGRIQTGSYTNKEGQKVYTTDVVVENHEFCESKNTVSGTNNGGAPAPAKPAAAKAAPQNTQASDGFLPMNDGWDFMGDIPA